MLCIVCKYTVSFSSCSVVSVERWSSDRRVGERSIFAEVQLLYRRRNQRARSGQDKVALIISSWSSTDGELKKIRTLFESAFGPPPSSTTLQQGCLYCGLRSSDEKRTREGLLLTSTSVYRRRSAIPSRPRSYERKGASSGNVGGKPLTPCQGAICKEGCFSPMSPLV